MTARTSATTAEPGRACDRRGAARMAVGAAALGAAVAAALVLLVAPYAIDSDERDNRLLVAVDDRMFPDAAWRSYVSAAFDADGDGFLSRSETEGVVRIGSYDPVTLEVADSGVSGRGIASFEGIEHFPNLEMLVAQGSAAKSIDVTGNPKLRYLDMRDCDRFDISYTDEQMGLQVLVDGGVRVISEEGAR